MRADTLPMTEKTSYYAENQTNWCFPTRSFRVNGMTKNKLMSKFPILGLLVLSLSIWVGPQQAKSQTTMSQRYEAEWKEIDSLEAQGLPQSALAKVEALYVRIKKETEPAQLVKAVIYREKFKSQLEEKGQVKAIQRLEAEVDQSDFPVKQVLYSMLGELYSQYLTENYWQIAQRTQTAGFDNNDLETWSATQFMETASKYYNLSLQDERLLGIPIKNFSAIMTEGNLDEPLRPTLYDFLAHRVIDYFSNDRSYLPAPAYKFYINQPEVFDDASAFAALKFETKDQESYQLKTMLLMQDLIRRHLADADPVALIDVDLKRLQFLREKSSVPDKESLYLAALNRLKTRYSASPVYTEILHAIASWHVQQPYETGQEANRNNLITAKELCDEAIRRFPKSYGAAHCKVLLAAILEKNFSVQVELVNLPGQPSLMKVNYRNVGKLYFKVVQLEEADIEALHNRNGYSEDGPAFTKKKKSVLSWSLALPATEDYREHTTETIISKLPLGYYAVLAAEDEKFDKGKKAAVYALFQVSNIAGIRRNDQNGSLLMLVTDRAAGAPMEGVMAEFYTYDYERRGRTGAWKKVDTATSDKEGRIVPGQRNKEFMVKLSKGKDVFWVNDRFSDYTYGNPSQSSVLTHFFLDRAIYRPGQTIYFKAIILQKDKDGIPSIWANQKVIVSFFDANQQEVAKLELMSNQYGTVNGNFIAPRTGLMGAMSIQSSLNGYTGLRVEEYKRPKFEVKIDPVEGAPKLGDKIAVKGVAQTYAGSNVDGAEVRYRVVRQVRYPWWPWWKGRSIYPPRYGEEMEIANGETTTDANGKFQVEFTALADPATDKKDRPSFHYTVYADVIDINGETHSAERSVELGYLSLTAGILIPEAFDRTQAPLLVVYTNNLDGQKVAAKGKITIQRLDSPAQYYLSRYWEKPDQYTIPEAAFKTNFPNIAYKKEDERESWAVKEQVYAGDLDTGVSDSLRIDMGAWAVGYYVVTVSVTDPSGQPVESKSYYELFDRKAKQVAPNVLFRHETGKPQYEPGEEAQLNLISGLATSLNVRLEIENGKGDGIARWVKLAKWKEELQAITEQDRGNLPYLLTFIYQNRFYTYSGIISVPWSNKDLTITYQTFRDKLRPGQEEEWQLKISGPKKESVAAEMVAAMYDASLDALAPHNWSASFFPYNYNQVYWYGNDFRAGDSYNLPWSRTRVEDMDTPMRAYRQLNWFGWIGGGYYRGNRRMYKNSAGAMENREMMMDQAAPEMSAQSPGAPPPPPSPGNVDSVIVFTDQEENQEAKAPAPPPSVRTNLKETVFFSPQLNTDAEGNILIKFTMNEALTRWKFMAFAHTKTLQFGLSSKEIVTQKELMVLPNAPRFVREGDQIEWTAKVTNLTDKPLKGSARLLLFDAVSMEPVDQLLGNQNNTVNFSTEAGQSARLAWNLKIPAGKIMALTHRIVAEAGDFADGEESAIPVLTNRMLVTETLPLPVRGGQSKSFTLKNLSRAGDSRTLQHHKLSLEFTSNPAWYAVKALPYLMEYPYECTEQIFNRFYANSLASAAANRHPKIKNVFEAWKNTDALESNLTKNQDLKSALLEETPWVLEAQSEAQQRQHIGLLFDLNRMADEKTRALSQLAERQSGNGGFAWFAGGRESWYITQYIVEGLGHLNKLGVGNGMKSQQVKEISEKAIRFIDLELLEAYRELEKNVRAERTKFEDDHLDGVVIHYLYARSFFKEQTFADVELAKIHEYYLGQAEKYWTGKGLYEQGLLALALRRYDKKETALRVMRSLKERALKSEELGMYWNYPRGYFWNQLPIETHALLTEAFAEVAEDEVMVEELKIWLLKNKQTNHWKTTKATAAAVYVLLANGANWLTEDAPVKVSFPNVKKKKAYTEVIATAQKTAEAGTGYFRSNWDGDDINKDWSKVKVENPNKTVAWGGLYWQYFENLDKIKTFEETPLQLKKQLFREEASDTGPVLRPIGANTTLHPGDKVVVRIELRVDRDMEYVHMKDMRASSFEPLNVLSSYKWQGGLGYYESTRDAATNFFFDQLYKGTYVFEYAVRATHKGNFSNGITSIQCMYAPEFSSHSEGIRVDVD